MRDGNLSFQQCDHQEVAAEERRGQKKRRAREQQLVTHFLRSRQEPDQGVLAFFASSAALIPLTVFNKEVDPQFIHFDHREKLRILHSADQA